MKEEKTTEVEECVAVPKRVLRSMQEILKAYDAPKVTYSDNVEDMAKEAALIRRQLRVSLDVELNAILNGHRPPRPMNHGQTT